MKISAVVLTKNEENNIERCLKSIGFCDEIIIIDDDSVDKTINIIQNLKFKVQNYNSKLKIFQRNLNNDFSGQRNFGMEKATGNWILFVDADEEVTREHKFEIRSTIWRIKFEKNAYYIKRRDFWWGKELKYGETRKLRDLGIIRLVRKKSGKWTGKVHEIFKPSVSVGLLKSFLNHYPHPSLQDFIGKINYYSSLRAKELYQSGKKPCLCETIFNPFFKFCLNYFIYLGFLDGVPGFAYAFLMSFHSFLVRAKLFQFRMDYEKSKFNN